MPLTGHCNCSAITVTLEDQPSGEPWTSVYCHCMTCKRQSGASGTYVVVADENLVKVDDPKSVQKAWKDTLTDSGTPLDRIFCGTCGSPIITITPIMPGKTIVKMGLFDTIPKAVAECYTKNKQDWEPSYGVAEFLKTPE